MLKPFRIDRLGFHDQLLDMSTEIEKEVVVIQEIPLVGIVDVEQEDVDPSRDGIETNEIGEFSDGHQIGMIVHSRRSGQTQPIIRPIRLDCNH